MGAAARALSADGIDLFGTSATPPAMSTPRVIAASVVGNIIEWYDFAVYGYFAATIGRHFFPREDPTTSLIAAFGVFAAGFLDRPLGGVVFGHIGDRVGRKPALTLWRDGRPDVPHRHAADLCQLGARCTAILSCCASYRGCRSAVSTPPRSSSSSSTRRRIAAVPLAAGP